MSITTSSKSVQRGDTSTAQAIVDALVAAGVDHAFTVPGESFLPLLDALYDEPRIRTVTTRHEGGAAFMAEAYAKLTRRPAVCMATRAVGASNLAIGLHTARQDDSPVIALLGQVDSHARHREGFQEADLAQMLAPLTKWSAEPTSAHRLGELAYQAARIAVEGRPGPVAVSLMENLLYSKTVPARPFGRLTPARMYPDPGLVAQAAELLRRSRRPCLLLGVDVLATGCTDLWVRIAEAATAPVLAAWRRPDVFPNDHPSYVGHTGLGAVPSVRSILANADYVLAVGCRLDENTTAAYSLPSPHTALTHVYTDVGRLTPHEPGAGIPASADAFGASLLEALRHEPPAGPGPVDRRSRVRDLRAAWERETRCAARPVAAGFADQFTITRHLRDALSPDTIVVSDAGNFSSWSARYFRWNQPGTFLGPVSGAMGYAVPAAVAASLARPSQRVVALAGDGGFLMTAAEVQTAVREHATFTAVVFDNGQYGTIRMHQQQHFPGRQIATDLGAADLAGMAVSLGAWGRTITAADEFPDALADARVFGGPAVIAVKTDPEQISVNTGATQ